jgi:hypothetical protein
MNKIAELLNANEIHSIADVIGTLLSSGAKTATKYVSEKLTIRASRRIYRYNGKPGNDIEVVLTIGKPNFEAREFIKLCKKAKEPFPVKKIQLKFPPKK